MNKTTLLLSFLILIVFRAQAQNHSIFNSKDIRFIGNRSNILSVNGDNTSNKSMLVIGEQQRYGIGFKWNSSRDLDIVEFDNQNFFSDNPTKLGHFGMRTKVFHWSGKIGIGTTAPEHSLHIKNPRGNAEVRSQNQTRYSKLGSSGAGGYIGATNSNGQLTINLRGYGDSFFNAGKVGIGTTTPDAKLTVNGKIHCGEVKVDLNVPGPDYVFEEDYNLRSLEDTRTYIQTNKHLPEIPSAKEMEKNGVDLSEMNMLLLKKIEELTLYVIKQNERIEELEKRL